MPRQSRTSTIAPKTRNPKERNKYDVGNHNVAEEEKKAKHRVNEENHANDDKVCD